MKTTNRAYLVKLNIYEKNLNTILDFFVKNPKKITPEKYIEVVKEENEHKSNK